MISSDTERSGEDDNGESNKTRLVVENVIRNVLRDAGREVPPLTDDALLSDQLRLDSLDFAVVVVGLEREIGVDPFRTASPRIRTFGELVRLYEEASSS